MSEINANPTKSFFIDMLTKDIPLIRAIIDLVDNSIDGALRTRPDGNYHGLRVKIQITENEFIIEDNCGGISLDVAENYAFRFGRPEDIKGTPNSIGRFGVGMKRAIFKIGKYFEVESKTDAHHYVIRQDIEKWNENNNWTFQIESLEDDLNRLKENGTQITVKNINESIKAQFSVNNFITKLIIEMETAQQIYLNKGFEILINDTKLKFQSLILHRSEDINYGLNVVSLPLYPDVKVRIYTGISQRKIEEGGWYLFCNGRLILGPSQDEITGWNLSKTTPKTPKYHPEFAYFRGYVYFESEDASLLPWNTTKTSIDTDSPIYRAVRLEMIKSMKPVTEWLRKLAKQQDETEKLDEKLVSSKGITLFELISNEVSDSISFKAFDFNVTSNDNLVNIQYKVEEEKADKVRKHLGITSRSNKDVGLETFNYFYKWEIEE